MIDGVGKGFLEGFVGEVEKALSLRPHGMLDHAFAEKAGLDECQCLAQRTVERTTEDFLLEAIAAGTVGKIDDIDLGLGEEPMRLLVEEE
jgi:hypothetical protein